ncbi:MAG: hypothetical protein COC10_04465 [Sphingobium sp.]|nr:MAG: hypothetical protein COC10_04465 [Sphingobium sp.]
MNPRPLAPRLSNSSHISLSDIDAAHAQGFRSIIVKRPRSKEPARPGTNQMRQAATRIGPGSAAIPVVPDKLTVDDVVSFADALTLERQALACCRTGKRPSSLSWLLKEKALPWTHWKDMVKGHEWLARPDQLPHAPIPHVSTVNPRGESARNPLTC